MMTREGEEQAARLRARRSRLVRALVPPIETAVARGELRPVAAEMAAHFCFTALLGYLFQACGTESGDVVAPSAARFHCAGVGPLVTLVFEGLGADRQSDGAA